MFLLPNLGLIVPGSPPLPALLFKDTMTDSDATALASHTPEVDVAGSGWTITAGTWTINSNQVEHADSFGTSHFAHTDTGTSDVAISATLTTGTEGVERPGIIIRFSDSSNYWHILIDEVADQLVIQEVNAGTPTARAFVSVAIALITAYQLQVFAVGQTITAVLDGTTVISYTLASFNQFATKHGFHARAVEKFDNMIISEAS